MTLRTIGFFALVISAALLPLTVASRATASAPGGVGNAIGVLVTTGASSDSDRPISPRYRDWLGRVYDGNDFAPVWFTPDGVRPAVAHALAELRAADTRGLSPDDYASDLLQREVAMATSVDRSPDQVARADVSLTLAMLRFLADLRVGRIPPQSVERHYRAPAKDFGFVASLRQAVAANTLGSAIDAVEPSFPLYGRLKHLLAQYRSLAAQPSAPLPPLPPKASRITAGDAYAGTAALHDRLVLLGDLSADAAKPTDDRYSGELAEALKRFQVRHGLTPDGVLGRQTHAELNVPLTQRVRQIELSIERLRWLPELPPGPLIAVNIPSFSLRAFADLPASDRPALSMAVIVGRAMRSETPVFLGEIRHLEFSPYWNVPPGILRNELLPALVLDPSYLERHEMELVGTTGTSTPTTRVDAAALAALRSGQLRLRQRPGTRNALGGVKFVLPNTMEIYLHGTPARELFARTRRDFSHGCIRVADPMALVQFALRDQPDWTGPRIDAAMSSGKNVTVKLTTPLPVIVFYTTAIVQNDGRALFLADVYGHDRALDNALQATRGRTR